MRKHKTARERTEQPGLLPGEETPERLQMRSRPRVVVVGGGSGGLQVTRALRHAPVQTMVIDRHNYHLFQPLLYQVATADLSPADIAAPLRSILREQRQTSVLLAEVTGVDLAGQQVLLREGAVSYDFLVIATGAHHSYFGHEEWASVAPGLKSLDDAAQLRRTLLLAFEEAEHEPDPHIRQALLTFVLVGAGPTGVELAGALAELAHTTLAHDFRAIDPASARILLVEAAPRLLQAFPPALARKAQQALAQRGVEVCTSAPVEAIDAEGVLMGGERVQTRTVIWIAGVAASPAAHWLDAQSDRAGRVNVTDHLTLPNHPNVFVIGDTAGVSQQGKPLPGVAPVAMQEGRYVVQAIRRQIAGKDHRPPFRYHGRGNLATVGRAFGVVVLGPVQLTGWLAWLLWLSVHIFYLIGFRNRLVVLFQWAWAYVTRQRSARLITCEPSVAQEGEGCVSPGMSPARPAQATAFPLAPGEKEFVPALSEKEAVCPSWP